VFRRSSETGSDLWLWDLARGTEQRFTTDPSFNIAPFWSPRGDRIVFASSRTGLVDLYQKAASGTENDELLLANGNPKHPTQWSRDGRFIVYSENDPKTNRDIWVLPVRAKQSGNSLPFCIRNSTSFKVSSRPEVIGWPTPPMKRGGPKSMCARFQTAAPK
jgi:Tol biopolymer transport system component